MRVTSFLAGMSLVLAACGGDKSANQAAPPAATPPADQAAAPAATGKTWDVNMDFDGKVGKFDPEALTIKAGDIVRFHNHTGGPHNVGFSADSIPAGAEPVLTAAMKDVIGPLTGPLLVQPDATYEISFAGAPPGDYYIHCTPHIAFKMHGKITVQ
jgi:plastocyanin